MKRFYALLCAVLMVVAIGGNSAWARTETKCTDKKDNDRDGKIDCLDSDCFTNPACTTPTTETNCTDGLDNDGDGKIDCLDTDCASNAACQSAGRDVIVMATNDLGMHCACPGTEYFMLLPPFNTLRAQVIERGVLSGGTPKVLTSPTDIRVEYNIVENTDASLKADPYYATWMAQMPKYGFGSATNAAGRVVSVSGATLSGQMTAQAKGFWEVVGVPAFPDVSSNSPTAQKIMTDPLGGPNRNPYLTGNISVYEQSSNKLLAQTNATVPVAFGGCCTCHLKVTADHGLAATPQNSFNLMGQMHAATSGINFAQIDPDGDGVMGPIRCSRCHLDPAMGETTPAGYTGYAKSQYTFSDVLHRWHVQNATVLTYDPDLAKNCYDCHPGNNVNCYRDHHTNETIGEGSAAHKVWCTDCHGDLNQRVAEGQMLQPWSVATLPKCQKCHSSVGETGTLGVFGGSFLNSMSHKNDKILCSTCHGAPHAINPSNLAKDNEQNLRLQNDARAIGVCDVCHVGKSTSYGKPMH
ncbi:MAG: hypothetical protein COZ12_06675 [Deltaproteobacteria bacterium CG_4_10_14_3_um_filter_60_8]|nr:MAG: hypothetical protein AUK28_00420 [Desulfobacterales bacterium CG2_30_60_27]PIY21067.1 MAG: hypothetical protein COZ12_06675 [Deltaproteobacteria bacterium CG_4_10_14_3_um_filter_60_8]